MGVHTYQYNWDFFNEESERRYYFLGFVAADGYISDNDIEICISKQDSYLVEAFRDWIVPNKPIYERQRTNSVMLKISCKFMTGHIKEFFRMTSNNKGQEMQFPIIPDQFVKDFIRGIIDGDGSIDMTKGYKGIKTYIGPRLRILSNYDFLTELNNVTKRFVNHNTNAISRKGKENVYCVTYNFSTANNLLHWIYDYNVICLKRKYDKYLTVTGQVEDIV